MWEDFIILALYCAFALLTVYSITGPPLEQWLRWRQSNITLDDLYRWRDWLMFLWAILNLIILILWWERLLKMGPI
jgi:hypothetical protein